jgi:hypothetical protein
MTGANGDQFAKHARAVAHDLFGDPNKQLSTKRELRFGKHGSVSVDLETGQFYDHEQKDGGGVLWAIERVTGQTVAGGKAVEWMRQNGYDIEDRDLPPVRDQGTDASRRDGPRLDPNGNWIPNRVPDHGRLTKAFDYQDDNGNLAYQVCRYDWEVDPAVNPKGHEKTFVQRRPDSSKKNGWAYSMEGQTWLPYRLPELIEDISQGYEVYIVEGEKKVDMLREIGVPATCNHGGAGKFPVELADWFKSARVVLMPDNDEAGRKHMDLVGRRLEDVAKSIRILDLPDVPEKGGVDDWLPAGGNAEKLYDLAATKARPFTAEPFKSAFGAVPWLDFGKPGPTYEYLIKGVLTKGEQSMLLGESQSGKSFLAIDIAMAVARGADWFGRKTKKGGVVYQAGESAVGVRRRRFPAYAKHHGVENEPLPIVLLERPVDLFNSDEQMELFIEECRYWSKTFPVPLELIVIDTFNKATPGANENDGKDMGMVLARCDKIRVATGAHVMLVHHLNSGGTKARGHTSLFANVENVVTVRKVPDSKDGDKRQIREWVLSKQKDGEDGIGKKFVLPLVDLGTDADGDKITSCIIGEPAGRSEIVEDDPAGITVAGTNAVVLRAIYTAIADKGQMPPHGLGLPASVRVVARKDVSDKLRDLMRGAEQDEQDMIEGESDQDAEKRRQAARRQAALRAREFLFSRGVIGMNDEWIWLTGKRVRGFEPPPGSGWRRRDDEEGPVLDKVATGTGPDLPFDVEDFR